MKTCRITIDDLKIGDKFMFINKIRKTTYTLTKKIPGYVGEFLTPFILVDTQSPRSFTPIYNISASCKYGTLHHAYTENYTILKLIGKAK